MLLVQESYAGRREKACEVIGNDCGNRGVINLVGFWRMEVLLEALNEIVGETSMARKFPGAPGAK
jgi:hypothetical protein